MSTSQGKNYPGQRPHDPYAQKGSPAGYDRNGYDNYNDRPPRAHSADNERGSGRTDRAIQNSRRSGAFDAPNNHRGSKKQRRFHKAMCITLIVLLMLSSTGYGLVQTILGSLSRVSDGEQTNQVISDADIEIGNTSDSDAFTLPDGAVLSNDDVDVILLVGSDHRLGASEPARSDTMMLVIIDRVHEKIKVVSIMRDLYAPITGGDFKLGSNKINFAFYYDSAYGNMDLRITKATISSCFGIEIDNFAVVDFMMFRTLINRLDGVEVELTKSMAKYMVEHGLWSSEANIGKTEAGTYLLNGSEALNYVRMRYVGEGDFDRTKRQRDFLNLMLEKIKSMSYTDIMYHTTGILPFITTDLSDGQIMGYAFQAADILKYDIVQLSFPIDGAWRFGWATIGSTNVSVLLTNFEFCSTTLRSFIYDDDMTYANGAEASGVVVPTVMTKIPLEETTTTDTETTATTQSSTSSTAAAETTAATTQAPISE